MKKQTKMWTTKDGRRIRICDMSDSHLINTIRMLERLADVATHRAISEGYIMLGCLRGEEAVASVEGELLALEECGVEPDQVCPLYSYLVDDAIRRHLNWR